MTRDETQEPHQRGCEVPERQGPGVHMALVVRESGAEVEARTDLWEVQSIWTLWV